MSEKQPSPEQLRAFREHPRPGPIQMINLLKFRDQAEYAVDVEENVDVSGREAYARYGGLVLQLVMNLGGRLVWSGSPETVLIGNDDDRWDEVAVVEYPSREAMLGMLSSPEHQAAHVHRDAGLAHQKLIQCRPGGTAIN